MSGTSSSSRRTVLIGVCLAAIAGASYSIWRTQFSAPTFNVKLHREMGRVLAEQTARAINSTGRVVVVAVELGGLPELRAQLREFEDALRRYPRITLEKSYLLETDDKPKYSFGSGLSGRRFVRVVNKNPNADAIVSFVGAPTLSKEQVAELKGHPKFITESRAADKLKPLFEQKLLHAAIVFRFQFPSPVQVMPRTPQEMFDQHCQVVTAAEAGNLPNGKGE